MIQVSEEAQKKYLEMLQNKEENTNIRIFVENPGKESAECGMAFCPSNMYDMADIVHECSGFKLIVDPISDQYLFDAKVGINEKGDFTLSAPSISKNFLDPLIPLIDRINFVVRTQINPKIATHGGGVEIVDFLDQKDLLVKFKGGCVGCSSVGETIKDLVHKTLIKEFPQIEINIIDVTNHQNNKLII